LRMEKIDLAIIGGGRKQSRDLIQKCVDDVSLVLSDLDVCGIWIDRCGRWWLLEEDGWKGCVLCGNRLMEVNGCLEIGAKEIGCRINKMWPIANMSEFSAVGLASWLEFSGVEVVSTTGLWSGVLQDSDMIKMAKDWPAYEQPIVGASQYIIGFVGQDNFLPSKLCQVEGDKLEVAGGQLERVVQLKIIDLIGQYKLRDLGIFIIRANSEDWKVKNLILQPEVHCDSWWAKLWQVSGLSYDGIIKRAIGINGF